MRFLRIGVRWLVCAAVAVCLCLTVLSHCSFDPGIPNGFIGKETHFDGDGFQDFTDYCKYYYRDSFPFTDNPKYRCTTAEDLDELRGYFRNFREWMAIEGRLDEFDFDISRIAPDNYVYIRTREHEPIGDPDVWKYADYTVYYFDVSTCVLYYIHTNI